MDNKQARYLHRMLDRLAEGKTLSPQDVETLRKNLPELPIQKTLEEIAWDIHFAWCETSGNDWKEDLFGDLETWLSEQHSQLRAHLEGVKSQAQPSLPAGMRIADHEKYGRVVVSSKPNDIGQYKIFHLDDSYVSGADVSYVEADALTFIDGGTFRLSPPEFLETKADYTDVPEGTILTTDGLDTAWVKKFDGWASTGVSYERTSKELGYARRRVLRWGWGK